MASSKKNTPVAKSQLLSRLRNDLKDFFENPYPGISVHGIEEDLKNFCLVLAPGSGPFWGLRLHFTVRLPDTWPSDPPQIHSSVNLNHPNIYGSYICTDLLRLESYSEAGYIGGYTPAFTLRGLFMQFLSFFASEQVEQEEGYTVYVGNRFNKFYLKVEEFRKKPLDSFTNDYSPTRFPETVDDEAYMKEFKAGGRCERVLSRQTKFTVWRPNQEGRFENVKVTWENPRYNDTFCKTSQFRCKKCGYGTSMPHMVPIIPPREHQFGENVTEGLFSYERELVKLIRKLRDIEALKERQLAGVPLETTQISKIESYNDTIKEIKEVEAEIKRLMQSVEPASIPEAQAPKTQTMITLSHPQQSPNKSKVCYLPNLNNDILLTIAEILPTSDLINFGKAFPYLHDLTTSHNIILRRELNCFFLRTPLSTPKTLLGVGVRIDKTGALNSSFDWLSMDAFENFDVRKSIDKKRFNFFLPLAFNPTHFDRAYESGKLFDYIDKIGAQNRKKVWGRRSDNPIFAPNETERRLNVLYKFCNSIIVSLMRTTDELFSSPGGGDKSQTLLYASEKACIGYLQIYHLLLCIMRREPDLRRRAIERIKAFCSDDRNRSKNLVPDLGEFLVMAAVVAGSYSSAEDKSAPIRSSTSVKPGGGIGVEDGWRIVGQEKREREHRKAERQSSGIVNNLSWRKDLVGPFMDEVLARGVRWVIMKHRSLETPDVDEIDSKVRLRNTFEASRTANRLVMFQVFFLETFATESITRQMDNQYGFTGPEVPAMITKGIKEIYEIKAYKLFCERIGLVDVVRGGPKAMNKKLVDAVVRSELKGYHTSGQKYEKPAPEPENDSPRYCIMCKRDCGAPILRLGRGN